MLSKVIKFFKLINDSYFFNSLLKGTAAGVEHIDFLKLIDVNHIIDVGANKGQFALVSRKFFPDARIDSFEPLKSESDIFEKVFSGDKNTFLHKFAIGRKNEKKNIYISKKIDSSSILPIGKNQTIIFKGTDKVNKTMINIKSLNNLERKLNIQKPVLLKIDVQGYELETLLGCSKLLNKIDFIYCECSFIELYEGQALAHDIIDYLYKFNFIFSGIYNIYRNKSREIIQADIFFKKV